MIDINLIIALSLVVLTICTFCILIVIVPVALQYHRTLNSIQHLVDTINDEVEPMVKEISKSVTQVKSAVGKVTSPVKETVNKVGIALISSAHGVVTGLKEYLTTLRKK